MQIRVKGLAEIQARLTPEWVGGYVRRALAAAGFLLESEAKRRAPVYRGQLRASIANEVDPAPMPTWVQVGTNVEYAPMMEYGTGRNSDGPGGKGSHFPPPGPLAAWAQRKGIKASGWALARAIAKKGGLKPRRFLRGAIEDNQAKVVQAMTVQFKKMEADFASGSGGGE